jgi:hypothetical protein
MKKEYGIMSPEKFREMTMAIARGKYKLPPDAPREYYADEKTAGIYHKPILYSASPMMTDEYSESARM